MRKRPPNLLIVVMDTQRAANMGCYGYRRPTTPNIDAIAAEGVTCLNNISPGSWTLPSHASLWTGRYVTSHGATLRHEYLEPGLLVLPEVLAEMGYATGGICNNAWAGHTAGTHRGFSWFPTRPELGSLKGEYASRLEALLDARAEERDKCSLFHVTLGTDWIEEQRRHNKPFFLYINCTEPHLRCWPPQPYRRRFLLRGVSDEEARAVEQAAWKITTGNVELTKRDWRIIKSLNDGETATLDARLKVLFDYLRETGLMDDTILIVTSDHGDELGEHPPFMAHVMTVYDTVVRVPLVIRYPKALPAGREIRRFTQTLDIFPTVMDILGCKDKSVLGNLQGSSILNHLRGKGCRTWALAEHDRAMQCFERYLSCDPNADIRWVDRSLKAYYRGRYKYIWASNGNDELYDLSQDPVEKRNLAAKQPKRVQAMRQELEELLLSLPRRNFVDYLSESPEKRGKQHTEDRLRAWGIYNDMLPPAGKPRFNWLR